MCPSAQIEDLTFKIFGWRAGIDSAVEVVNLVS
jgi:hypothetical protein